MKISSPAFQNNEEIPRLYTCQGSGVNPPLLFSDLPRGTKSLALIMDDIDAKHMPEGIWNHWLLWNLPPDLDGIESGVKQTPGISGHTTGGETEYQPPCPPSDIHRYIFQLYALSALLNIDHKTTRRRELLVAIKTCTLSSADLTGWYKKYEQ